MTETIKKPNHQFYLFVAGLILFSIIAVFGWIKLQYGFTFMDEGWHMLEGWRLSAGDHFIRDTPTEALQNFRLFTKLIFEVCPSITLLGFRKLQFFLTLISLFIFGSALYRFDKQYWYLPFIFSIFAFTGLDTQGATSNLSYYTYPHLFLVLHLACLLLGLHAKNALIKSLLFLFSGACLCGISLNLLHQSPVIAGPIVLYSLAKFLNFKQIEFRFKDLAIVLFPFFLFWTIFLTVYNTDYIYSVVDSLNKIRRSPAYSSELITINWTVLAYTAIMFILGFVFLAVLKTFNPHKIGRLVQSPRPVTPAKAGVHNMPEKLDCGSRIKPFRDRPRRNDNNGGFSTFYESVKIIYLFILSILTFWIIDTSFFGILYPYWKDWYSRPMWFAGLLISFHLFFWLRVLANRLFFKQDVKPYDELAILLMLPATLLFIFASIFSGFGAILILHCAIPTVTAIALMIINLEPIRLRTNAFKLIILTLAFAPFYYTTAWSDWNFTYCDVKPKHANAEITDGFLKGIHTNGVYKQLNDLIRKNTAIYSNKDEFIISYILSPMVYMIAERRPAIEESFIGPPDDFYMKLYQKGIQTIQTRNRPPALAFVFDNSPAINTMNDKSKIPFNLKGDTYSFFGPWYAFEKSIDPLADYIRRNMTMVDSITYAGHTARCFVDNKRLAETLLQQSLTLQPDNFQTLNRLTMLHIQEKNYTDAIALLSGPMLKLQPDNAGIYYNIACLFAIQNNREHAVEWLRRAVEKGYDKWDKIKTDPDLENIRDSAYYQEIIKNH
jgi:tetratricopeptide (TPR) repeat protein